MSSSVLLKSIKPLQSPLSIASVSLWVDVLFSRNSRKLILKVIFVFWLHFLHFLEFVYKFCAQIFPYSDHFWCYFIINLNRCQFCIHFSSHKKRTTGSLQYKIRFYWYLKNPESWLYSCSDLGCVQICYGLKYFDKWIKIFVIVDWKKN
jgi:hypothetical protein